MWEFSNFFLCWLLMLPSVYVSIEIISLKINSKKTDLWAGSLAIPKWVNRQEGASLSSQSTNPGRVVGVAPSEPSNHHGVKVTTWAQGCGPGSSAGGKSDFLALVLEISGKSSDFRKWASPKGTSLLLVLQPPSKGGHLQQVTEVRSSHIMALVSGRKNILVQRYLKEGFSKLCVMTRGG